MSTTPKRYDPLTVEEMEQAANTFFPLFNIINNRMPKGASTEDTLKVMETVAKLGHKNRSDKADKEKSLKFGFNKTPETTDE